eukprot:2439813-Prymnesium_polylepis.1
MCTAARAMAGTERAPARFVGRASATLRPEGTRRPPARCHLQCRWPLGARHRAMAARIGCGAVCCRLGRGLEAVAERAAAGDALPQRCHMARRSDTAGDRHGRRARAAAHGQAASAAGLLAVGARRGLGAARVDVREQQAAAVDPPAKVDQDARCQHPGAARLLWAQGVPYLPGSDARGHRGPVGPALRGCRVPLPPAGQPAARRRHLHRGVAVVRPAVAAGGRQQLPAARDAGPSRPVRPGRARSLRVRRARIHTRLHARARPQGGGDGLFWPRALLPRVSRRAAEPEGTLRARVAPRRVRVTRSPTARHRHDEARTTQACALRAQGTPEPSLVARRQVTVEPIGLCGRERVVAAAAVPGARQRLCDARRACAAAATHNQSAAGPQAPSRHAAA